LPLGLSGPCEKEGISIKRFATLKDVAIRAETTIATASFVLNGAKNRYITPELRGRVEKAARELNYVKHGAASSLKGEKMGLIAVLSPQYANPYFLKIFESIEHVLHKKGYVLATLNTFDDPEREKYAINQMAKLRVDGFLVIPTIAGGDNTEHIRKLGLPFVAIERPLNGVEQGKYDFISSDNLGATYTLTAHALQYGHKKIALAYWESEISSNIFNLRDRKTGYINALAEYGLEDSGLIFEGDINRSDGESITERILQQKDITAIVYAHYILAEGGIQLLRKKRVKVPQDISVLMLGEPSWMDMAELDFTHVVQPGWRVGEQAALVLIDKIEKRKKKKMVEIVSADFHKGTSVLNMAEQNNV